MVCLGIRAFKDGVGSDIDRRGDGALCGAYKYGARACGGRFSEDYSEAAKNAKDSAAGAVLICAFGAAAAGIAVFFDAVRLRAAFDTIFASVPRLVIFAAITVFAVPFVFMSGKKKDDRKG